MSGKCDNMRNGATFYSIVEERRFLFLMYRYQYSLDKESGRICITGLPFETKFVEVPREKRFERLYSYGLIN